LLWQKQRKKRKLKPQRQRKQLFIPAQPVEKLQKHALIFVHPLRPNKHTSANIAALLPATLGTFARQWWLR